MMGFCAIFNGNLISREHDIKGIFFTFYWWCKLPLIKDGCLWQRSYRGYLIFDSFLCIFSEDILKSNVLAFEEVKKRLEKQHAQQLSILIAEQEREQEELKKVRSTGKILSKGFVLCGSLSGSNWVWVYILLLCRVRKIVSCLNLPFVGTGRAEEKFKRREGYYNGNRNFQSEY